MSGLHALAEAVGLARGWRDAKGKDQIVADDALAAILARLGYRADSERAVAAGLAQHAEERRRLPALVTVEQGGELPLPEGLRGATAAEGAAEDGGAVLLPVGEGKLRAAVAPGYYRVAIAGREIGLAVAPRRCVELARISERKLWGPAVQIPALRGAQARPFGGFGELAQAAALFAARGADALAISPVHALHPGDGGAFSPYTPSSRLFLNTALADPALAGLAPLPDAPGGALIGWGEALPQRLVELRATFAALGETRRGEIAAWSAAGGEALRRHALYDALYCRFMGSGARGWQGWPAEFHDSEGAAARRFAAEHADEIAFHGFTQWLARTGLDAAQRAAREGGMALGLIADLAVGVDPGGSDAWGLRRYLFDGLTIGAPPDPLGPEGQNWGLTGFSPTGLRASGFAPWIAMIRAALASAGGVRIDHAFGLARLWIVPAGRPAGEGAYLAFPFADMLRLLALESHRAGAIIVAEDLGTSPSGFSGTIADRAMLGMRVLWFERDADGRFRAPGEYRPDSIAMTGTHDTATVAGWWTGRDIDWAERVGRLPTPGSRAGEEARREHDRAQLWSTIGHGEPQPAAADPAPAVAAALEHVGRAGSRLALVPLEDLLAIEEQPNLPGTIDEHPNWRRRLPGPLAELLDQPDNAARVATVDAARRE